MTEVEILKNESMNTCEEYKEAIAANPSFDGGVSHLSQCASCDSFRSEMQALDSKIRRALALSVPEFNLPELPDIDTSNVTSLPQRLFAVPAWVAIAATFTLVAFIGFRMLGNDLSNATLVDQIVAHLDHEPYSIRVTDKAVSDERLLKVVPESVATMDHSAGLITYAQSCVINGHEVPHLVIQGERGPVTILLLPDEHISGPESFRGDSVRGVILPVGNGSIAIIGEEGERLERIEEQVKNSVTWST